VVLIQSETGKIRHLQEKPNHRLRGQFEIQQIQIELLQEIGRQQQ